MADITINDLWYDRPQHPELVPREVLETPTDRASLIFETYRLLGLFKETVDRDAAIAAVGVALNNLTSVSNGLNLETFLIPPAESQIGFLALLATCSNLPKMTITRREALWDKYNGSPQLSSPSVGSVRGMIIGKEKSPHQEKGLYFVGKDATEQQKQGQLFIDSVEGQRPDLTVAFFDPASYLCINAIRYVAGERLLDAPTGRVNGSDQSYPTHTRFVGMDPVSADNKMQLPGAEHGKRKRLTILGSAPHMAHAGRGVRFMVSRKNGVNA